MNESEAHPAPVRKRRWLRVVLVVFVLLVVAYASCRYILHRKVEARLDAIRNQGYPVTLAELDAWKQHSPMDLKAAAMLAESCSRTRSLEF